MSNTVRTLTIEVLKIEGDVKGMFSVSHTLQRVANRYYRIWELYHIAKGHDRLIHNWMKSLAAWHRANNKIQDEWKELVSVWVNADRKARGKKPKRRINPTPKPKCPVNPFPPGLDKLIYDDFAEQFPDVHGRVWTLVSQKLRKTITSKNAIRSAYKVWMMVLADRERTSGFRRSQPIPFDTQNSGMEIDEEGNVWLWARVQRVEENGRGVSEKVRCLLKTKGRAARYAVPVVKMAGGEIKPGGSSLYWNESRRKWFALVTYSPDPVEQPELDENKVLFIKPGLKRPWWRRVGGHTRGFAGRGRDVAFKRSRLLQQRFGRSEAYRFAAGRKGHGSGRGVTPQVKLSLAWNHFTKTHNQVWVHELISQAVELGCGQIVLFNPEHHRGNRFLERAGKLGRNDATSWPFFQFESLLQTAAAPLGITVTVHKAAQRYKSLEAVH